MKPVLVTWCSSWAPGIQALRSWRKRFWQGSGVDGPLKKQEMKAANDADLKDEILVNAKHLNFGFLRPELKRLPGNPSPRIHTPQFFHLRNLRLLFPAFMPTDLGFIGFHEQVLDLWELDFQTDFQRVDGFHQGGAAGLILET